jgi:hypothetical protein
MKNMISTEDAEWDIYCQYLDERDCLCEQNDDCICMAFEAFIDKYYQEIEEEKIKDCI